MVAPISSVHSLLRDASHSRPRKARHEQRYSGELRRWYLKRALTDRPLCILDTRSTSYSMASSVDVLKNPCESLR